MSVKQRCSRQEGRQAGCHGCVCMCLSPVRLDVHRHVNLTHLCGCACMCALRTHSHMITHGSRRCNISYSGPGNTVRWKYFSVRLIFFFLSFGSLLPFNSDCRSFRNTPPPLFFPSIFILILSFVFSSHFPLNNLPLPIFIQRQLYFESSNPLSSSIILLPLLKF